MNPTEKFEDILKNEKVEENLPFLSSLDAKGKKQVATKLKASRYVWEYNMKTVKNDGWSYQTTQSPKGTEKQKQIYALASFFCHTKQEFQREWGAGQYLSKKVLDEVLPIYCPTWFVAYTNEISKEGWAVTRLDYHELVDLEKQGYLKLRPELVVSKLAWAITTREERKSFFTPARLWEDPVTLEKHIWYLFEYEANIYVANNYNSYENFDGKSIWQATFKLLADDKHIDRARILEQALLASNRNFNKIASGWYMDLFLFLDPSIHEILDLQPQLYSLFSSPHSKVINGALKLVKMIQGEPSFDADEFLVNTGMLLSSETKSIIKSSLQVLDKIAKGKAGDREDMCSLVIQVFIHQDSELQLRAAKFIEKYCPPGSEMVPAELSVYQGTLMREARAVLGTLLVTKDEEVTEEHEEGYSPTYTSLQDFEILPVPIHFDEFLFLASQAFDNNEPYHFDTFLAGIIAVHDQVKGDNIEKLEPVLQRALKRLTDDWPSNVGYLDNLLSVFFVEYCEVLYEKYPKEARTLSKLANAERQQDLKLASNSRWYHQRITPLNTWHTSSYSPAYYLFKNLLVLVLEKVKIDDTLPLLSTPTHMPCWLEANSLVDRVKRYQQDQVNVDALDLQIALARCFRPSQPPPRPC